MKNSIGKYYVSLLIQKLEWKFHIEILNFDNFVPCAVFGCQCNEISPNASVWFYNDSFDDVFSIEVSEDDVLDEAFEDVSSSNVDIALVLLLLQKAKIF